MYFYRDFLIGRGWPAPAGVLGVALYLFAGLPSALTLAAEPACEPRLASCRVQTGQRTVTLRLEGDVKPLHPFTVRVTLDNGVAPVARQVWVRFTMAGMAMGLNRFGLQRQADGVWQGQALLPVCGTGRRDWRIAVEVSGDALEVAEFTTVLQ